MDKKTRDELIINYAPLVKNIVGRIAAKVPIDPADKEDLLNIGILGLISALDNYDQARSVRFETYAGYRIRGAVLDELRARDCIPRQARTRGSQLEDAAASLQKTLRRPPDEAEIAKYLGFSLDEYHRCLDDAKSVSVMHYEDISPDFLEAYNAMDVVSGIDRDNPFVLFSSKEMRGLIKAAIDALPDKERMVLSLYYFDELTMKEIGRVMELTESRVCQLHSQAIIRIRGSLKDT